MEKKGGGRMLGDLWKAVESGSLSEVEAVLRSGRRAGGCWTELGLNQVPGQEPMTVLHLAVGNNLEAITELLLKEGADPNCVNAEGGLSPLHLSVLYDQEPLVRLLVKAGGDPLIRDSDNKNCLHYVLENDLSHLLLPLTEQSTSLGQSLSLQVTETEVTATSDSFFSCKSRLSGSEGGVGAFPEESAPNVPGPVRSNDPSLNKASESEVRSTASPSFTSSYSTEKGISDFSYLLTDEDTRYGSVQEVPSSKSHFFSPALAVDRDKVGLERDTTEAPLPVAQAQLKHVPTSPCPSVAEMERLREATQAMGISLPVTASTFRVLSKFLTPSTSTPGDPSSDLAGQVPLALTQKNHLSSPAKGGFSAELKTGLRNLDLILSWGSNLRVEMLGEVQKSENLSLSPGRRRGSKSFFNYLLLDPHIIKRANFSTNPLHADSLTKNPHKFETFLRSVFYIGKGCGNRPLHHLVQAKKKLILNLTRKPAAALSQGEKVDKVLEIWGNGQGVIVHSVFHHSLEREASATEAAMIDAVGISCQSLTNLKKGSYDGTIAATWTQKAKNQYGAFLLYKTFCTFLVSDPKAFLPHDV